LSRIDANRMPQNGGKHNNSTAKSEHARFR